MSKDTAFNGETPLRRIILCSDLQGVTVVMQKTQKKKTSKTTSRQRNTVEYIAGKSFLFISLKEKLDLTLFSVRRSQYFISGQRKTQTADCRLQTADQG